MADSLITCLSPIKCYHAEFGRSTSTGVGTGGESTGAPTPWEGGVADLLKHVFPCGTMIYLGWYCVDTIKE